MFQAMVGSFVSAFGAQTGLELFRMVCFLSVLGLVILFLRRLKSPAAVYLLVLPMLTLLIQQRPVTRPELISYSLIVLAVILYHRARVRMSPSTMLPIVFLIGFWTNYHSAIFAYVIFFGLFIDTAFRFLRERAGPRDWLKWAGWGVVVVAAGAMRPGFGHPILGYFAFASEWKALIMEYSPLSAKLAVTSTMTNLGTYAVGLMAATTLVLAAGRRQYGLLLVGCLLIYFAVDMSRLVTPNGIAMLCFFAWMTSEVDVINFIRHLPRWTNAAVGATALAVFGFCMYAVVWSAQQNMLMNRTLTTGFPVDVADYMLDRGISGRVFNEYQHGGYLIYRLAPQVQVYIDGRTNILYPLAHAKHYTEVRSTPALLVGEIDKHDINLALLINSKNSFTLAEDTGRLKLDFVGFNHSLFRRDEPNFPLLGTLLARPACWSTEMAQGLLSEREQGMRILPKRSLAIGYFDLLADYSAAAEKQQFISDLDDFTDWNEHMFRFVGYRALELGLSDRAWDLLNRVRPKEFADYLAGAMAKAERGDWRNSERALDNLTQMKWPIVRQHELVTLRELLLHIRANAGLELFGDAYLDGLAQQVEDTGGPVGIPSVQSLCPER